MHQNNQNDNLLIASILNILFSKYLFYATILLSALVSFWALKSNGQFLRPRIPFYLMGLVVSYGILMMGYRYRNPTKVEGFQVTNFYKTFNKKYLFVLLSICLVLYIALSALLYGGWYQGSDYIFAGNSTFNDKLSQCFNSYIHWVSRSGELAAYIVGSPQNRWQMYIIVPAVVVIAPFLFFRLVTTPAETIISLRGIYFYILCISLLLLSTNIANDWNIFYAYAVAMNYLFPSIIAVLFFSYYNHTRWKRHIVTNSFSVLNKSLITFLLGCYVCWGGESLSLIILGSLVIFFIAQMRGKRYIPFFCWSGLSGGVIGTTMLFAAPALSMRSKIVAESRVLDPSLFSPEQMQNFVTSLTWEKIELLKGASDIVVLNGIPFWQHMYFLPYLLERYFLCGIYVISALVVLLFVLCIKSTINKKGNLIIIGNTVGLSILGASSYLYSCLPQDMSFFPATIVLLCAVCYTYWRCNISLMGAAIISSIATLIVLCFLVPAGVEAWQYKHYEELRFREIARQKASGCRHIVLTHLYSQAPVDSLGMIGAYDLKENPHTWPNNIAARAYGVETITLMPLNIDKSTHR